MAPALTARARGVSGGCGGTSDGAKAVPYGVNVLEGGRKRRHLPGAAFLWQLAVCVAGAAAVTWLVLHI
jgi:hypothetical protein